VHVSRRRFNDPHIHLWDLGTGWYPWFESRKEDADYHGMGDGEKFLGRNYLLDDYFADAKSYDVEKIVHVTAAQTPPSLPDETRFLQEMFEEYGQPHGIIGGTYFERSIEDLDAELAAHAEYANFRGVRQSERIDFGSEHTTECFAVMQRRNLIFDMVATNRTLPKAAALAKQFDQMTFVLEHTGWPIDTTPETFAAWRIGMEDMASSPNTAVKISGLGRAMHEWTVEDFRPWVETAIDVFGTDRCMFASNFPIDGSYADYDTLIGAYEELTSGASEDERQALFAGNTERWYRI
jgi:predicted TIM-barrel fold metal-dependent hydrolase